MTNLFTINAPTKSSHQTLTDAQLYGLCKQYGHHALEARRKFIGLLPEVYKRHLYAQKGFSSIEEFAAKLAGISEEQVRLALRLERKFKDKPDLKMALTSGAVSVKKLARVASIATSENQKHIAEMAKVLPKSALEVFVRDEKSVPGHVNPQRKLPDVNLAENEKSVPGDINLLAHLDVDLQKDLLEREKKGIDINQLLKDLLQKHDEELAKEKQKLAKEAHAKAIELKKHGKKPSRYIPAAIRRQLQSEHGKTCSIRTCQKPATTIHHTQRFALSQNHDPNFLAPLCREHHAIAHTIDEKYFEKRR
ncbi:hypothetical protein KJ835_02850 [Patescibacteria group bacterium]|nr:hypothetical protein [Patescibacteria group bacterium]MBU1954133.1 hypothetical protein [Patescibacteria group bacterium]